MGGTNLKEFNSRGEKIVWQRDMKYEKSITLEAQPRDLIIRCVTIRNRRTLDLLLREMKIDLNTIPMKIVRSDAEWAVESQNGKKTYLICSMGNFQIVGSNGFSYASGPVHKDEYIYRDEQNYGNAMIVLDHELTFMPQVPEDHSVERKFAIPEEDEYLFHPQKVAKGANPPQLPVYNEKTQSYELTCSICGKSFPEKQVTYTYSRQNGYVYRCDNCNPNKSRFKRLTYSEKLAKLSHDDLDNYSFDGE